MAIIIMVLLLLHTVGSSVSSEENVEKEFTWDNLTRMAKSGLQSAVKMAMPFMFRAMSTANVSSDCERGLMLYFTAIRKLDAWALKMVDASSKIPSGILEGTLLDFGSFDECLGIRVKGDPRISKKKEFFRGRYCTMSFKSPLMSPPWGKTSDGRNYTDVYGHPPNWANEMLVKMAAYLKMSTIWMGFCVPSVCTKREIKSISTTIAGPFGLDVSVTDCQVDEPYVWKRSTLAAVCALGSIALLCVLGTLLDVRERWQKSSSDKNHKDGVTARVAKAFSVLINTQKLFGVNGRHGCLDCFNGMRFFSVTWIILGHAYIYPNVMKYAEYRSSSRLMDIFNGNLAFTIIENVTLAVSTFFFMSGFLLVYTTWKQLERNDGRINIFMFIVHKYWRMTPGILLLMVLQFLMPIIDSGPLWNTVLEPDIQKCQTFWWMNLLYIHNWWNVLDFCLPHTWYLSALMQLHIAGILLLVLTYRWRVAGVLVGLLTMCACIMVVVVYCVIRNYPMPVTSHMDNYDLFVDYGVQVYIKPFLHFPSYLVGMTAGFFVSKYRSRKLTVKYRTTGWIVAIVLALIAVYGVHIYADHVAARALYLIARNGWSLSLAWMTYACASGFGGIVNRILSFSAMRVLGQISFFTYLIHYLIIEYRVASARERIYNGHTELVFSAFSIMVSGFALAAVGYVAVEMPFAALEKIIFGNSDTKFDKENVSKGQTVVTPNGTVTYL